MKLTALPLRPRWSWPLALLAITILALALRWNYVSTAMVLQPVRGDATQYFAYAWNLAQHATFAKDAPGASALHPDNYRDPGYPLFLAFWMKWMGSGNAWYAAVLLSQALLSALAVTLVTQLGRHWLPPRWAFVAGLLMAVWPHSITIDSFLLSETLFGFLCALASLICAQAIQRDSQPRAVVAGFVFGMAALTNAMLLPFGVLLALFLRWRKLARSGICIGLAVGCMVLPGAWAIRNGQIPPPSADSSSLARALQNFEQGSWPGFGPAWRASAIGNPVARVQARSTLEKVDAEYHLFRSEPKQGAAAVVRRFTTHPLDYTRWYLIEKPALLWGWSIEIGQGDIYVFPTVNSPFQHRPAWIALEAICQALTLPLLLLALASLVLTWPARRSLAILGNPQRRAVLVSTLVLAGFVTIVYSTLQAEPRYSIPFRPFEILLAITPLWAVSVWWRSNRQKVAGHASTSSQPNLQRSASVKPVAES